LGVVGRSFLSHVHSHYATRYSMRGAHTNLITQALLSTTTPP
jgi:hypothetical protein